MITIIAVGKLKKNEYKTLTDEFIKRISAYSKITLTEIPDEDCDANKLLAINKEGKGIISKIPKGSYVIACDPHGQMFDSEAFAQKIQNIYNSSKSDICFIIGGSAGLSQEVKDRADMLFSFSKLTFAHNLFRVILTEQIYRAFKILNNETYHK